MDLYFRFEKDISSKHNNSITASTRNNYSAYGKQLWEKWKPFVLHEGFRRVRRAYKLNY